MNDSSDNVIRFVPRPLEIVALAHLVQHGRYANPRYDSFWLGSEEELSDNGEGFHINWSVKPRSGNKWEVIKVTRTFTPGEEPEDEIESSGSIDLEAMRSYLEKTEFPIGDELFEILKTRSD